MLDLGNRIIHDDGRVVLRGSGLEALLYRGRDLAGSLAEPCDDLDLYLEANRRLDTNYACPAPDAGLARDNEIAWHTPEPWASLDMVELCISRCTTDPERERCAEELILFGERDLFPLLRHMTYMVDTWRQHGVVWGVGRGSSVSSFVLHLIGINRINPMRYGLDHQEFFRTSASTGE